MVIRKKQNIYQFVSRSDKDRRALQRLFDDHRSALKGFLVSRLGDGPELEDVMQDVFERLAKVEDLSGRECSRGFILKIANNLLVDLARYKKVRSDYQWSEQRIESERLDEVTPERELQTRQQLDVIEGAIAKLKPMEQKAFVMSRFQFLDYQQIADQLNVSRRTVEGYICSAIAKLRKAIQRSEV